MINYCSTSFNKNLTYVSKFFCCFFQIWKYQCDLLIYAYQIEVSTARQSRYVCMM